MHRKTFLFLLLILLGAGGCTLKSGLVQEMPPEGQIDVQLGGIESVRFCPETGCLYYTVIDNNNRQVIKYDFTAQMSEALFSTSYEESLEDTDSRGSLLVTSDQYDVLGDILLLQGGKMTNLGRPFVREMSPRFSPDGSLIAALSREEGKTDLVILSREGKEVYRSEFSGAEDLAFGEGEVYLLRDREILSVETATGNIRVLKTSPLPKSDLFYDPVTGKLYYLSYPLAEDVPGREENLQTAFLTSSEEGREHYLFGAEGLHSFTLSSDTLFFTKGPKLSYKSREDLAYSFSSVYHYNNYLERTDKPEEILPLAEKVVSLFSPRESLLFLTHYINKLLETGYPRLAEREADKFSYLAEGTLLKPLVTKEDIAGAPSLYEEGMSERLIFRLYEAGEHRAVLETFSTLENRIRSTGLKNKLSLLAARSALMTGRKTPALGLLEKIINNAFYRDRYVTEAVSLYLKVRAEYKAGSGYSLNILSRIRDENPPGSTLFYGATGALMDSLLVVGDYAGALQEWHKVKGREDENREMLYPILLEIYSRYETEEGITAFSNILTSGYNGVYYKDIVSFLRSRAVAVAEEYEKEEDLLKARKIILLLREALPGDLEINRAMIRLDYLLGNIMETAGRYKALYLDHPEDPLMQYLYGFALTYVGTSYEVRGRTDLTLAAYEEALDLVVSSVGRRPQEGIMHLTLGWLYEEMERLGQGQYLEMALGEYKTGLALADTDDRLLRGYFEKNMANIYFKLRIFDKALDYYTAMSGKIPPYQGRQEEKQYLLRLSTIHYNLNQYEETASFDRKLLTLYLEDQDIRGQDYILKHLGMVTSLSGKHLESVRYFERALSLGLSGEDPVRQVLYHRNIAYNALLGDDTDKALFHAKKGLDLLQGDQTRKKEGGGLLDISIAMALSGAHETGAYRGFTPEMERNLLLSIMAAASMNKGEMSAAVDLFKEKLAVSDSPYADMVITNNFASLYYRIGNDQLLQEYLDRSLEISRENKFQKGLLINELSSLFLNMDSSPDPLKILEGMEERVKAIRDPDLQELHQWMMILAFMKTAPREESFSTLREAVDKQEKDFRRYEKIRSLLQRPGVSPAMKRLFYLFLHRFLGDDVLSSLMSLQGEDVFLDFLINIDAALLTRRSSPESCFEFLEKASDSINRADDKTAPRFAAFFRDKGYIPFQLLEDAVTEKTDFDRLVRLLSGFESFEERIRYLFYKPELFSQLDTVNLGNYFYYLGREDLAEASRYAEKLDQRARLISGIPFLKGESLRRMLSPDDIIAYRLEKKFLLLTRDRARIEQDIPPDATFIIDRKADSFRSSAYNAFSLSQLYLLYEGRHMPRPWSLSEGKPLIEESSGYFRLSGSLESDQVNPYASKAVDYTGLQFLKEGLTVDGLWVDEAEVTSPISMRLFTDILIYAGLNTIKIGEITFSYREMTEKQFASFLSEKTSEIDRRAYLYYKEGHYSRSFRELANLIPLLKARKDTATLTSRLYLMITIATDHLRDPELIRQELKEYISLKGLPESAYEKNLAILYERTGFYSRAIALYKEGRIPGDQTLQLASLYEKNGQYEEASELLNLVNTEESLIRRAVIHYKYFNENEKARALLEKVRSRDKQQTVELLKGSISLREGDYETAKALFRPLTESPERNIRINAAIGMANLLFKTNAYHECLDYIRRTLQSLPEKENQAERVILKNLLSLALLETGSEHLALSEIDSALETARRYNIVGETTALIINKSLILRETGRPEEALALLESELPEAQARNNSYLLKGLYRHLAITSYQLGSSGQALLYLRKMKDLSQLTPEESMYASYYTGLVTKDIPMLEKARQEALDIRDISTALEIANHLGLFSGRIDHFEMAVSLLEAMAEDMDSPGLQVKLLKKYQGIYRSLAEAYFDAGLFEKSFFTTEKVKRIAFLVNNPLGAGQSTLKPEEEEALDKLKKELYHLDLLMKNDASIVREYEARKEDLDRLKLEIAMNQKGSADIPGERDFAGTIPQGTLVLSFLVLENRTLLLSWLDGAISGYSIPAGKERLNEEVSRLRDLISETAGEEVIRGESSRLGDLLLPFDLPKSGHLVVSPSGVLNYLPFSLLVKKGEYLIDRFPVTYIPDLFMLRENSGAGPFRSILAVGNPDLDNPDLELYFAQKEAGEIRFIFGPITDILKGKAATEEAVREKMASKDYDIIHFACHGYFNRHYSLLSHLLFASGGHLDGRFDVEEIRNLTPQARLAVLSACDSGVGVLGEGDEVTALDRAFMKTEESAVISSLWRISDVATGMLFKHFYRELDKGTPAPLALWKAKKELRLFFPHPAYWSSMKYTGN